MTLSERVDCEPIRELLRAVSLSRGDELDALFDELAPVCELDRATERNLFQATLGDPNILRIGVKCTVRLQAHAYAAGIVIQALAKPDERDTFLVLANQILSWAVGLDLQRWLSGLGIKVTPEQVLPGGSSKLPEDLLGSLSKTQRILGEGLFRYATAFILLHEVGHLKLEHTRSTYETEKDADRFAAEWMSEAAFSSSGDVEGDRLSAMFGIAVALLWLTVFNVFFGQQEATTHPEGYDRLYQVLDHTIGWGNRDEHQIVWYFVSLMLFIHMWAAGFDFDEKTDAIHMQGDPRDEVNYLIDRISKGDRKRQCP